MTNEELKKKICDIIAPYVSAYGDDERIADALIAAEIGDVSEWKERAENFSYAYNACGNDLAEMEHRAKVAERALENACVVILSSRNGDQPRRLRAYYKAYLEAAEKELSEEGK